MQLYQHFSFVFHANNFILRIKGLRNATQEKSLQSSLLSLNFILRIKGLRNATPKLL